MTCKRTFLTTSGDSPDLGFARTLLLPEKTMTDPVVCPSLLASEQPQTRSTCVGKKPLAATIEYVREETACEL
jgi:hypothetical protein